MSANRLFLTMLLILGALTLIAGCGSDPVAPVVPGEEEVPVLPPENVTAVTSDVDKLVITWDPNGHPQLRGYLVYRVETATQAALRLTEDPISETHYQDMSARRNIEYEYRVTATTKAGKESAYQSTLVTLQTPVQEGPGSQESRNASE